MVWRYVWYRASRPDTILRKSCYCWQCLCRSTSKWLDRNCRHNITWSSPCTLISRSCRLVRVQKDKQMSWQSLSQMVMGDVRMRSYILLKAKCLHLTICTLTVIWCKITSCWQQFLFDHGYQLLKKKNRICLSSLKMALNHWMESYFTLCVRNIQTRIELLQ